MSTAIVAVVAAIYIYSIQSVELFKPIPCLKIKQQKIYNYFFVDISFQDLIGKFWSANHQLQVI